MVVKSLSSFLTAPEGVSQNAKIDIRVNDTTSTAEKTKIVESARKAALMFDEARCAAYSATMHDGSFGNERMKTGSWDPNLNAAQFYLDMITFDRGEILGAYHSSWIFRRIIDKVAQDMWSSGISIAGDADPEDVKRVYKRLSRLSSQLIYATSQARLFGGAASLIMVNDHEDNLEEPLRLDNIKKGAFIRLKTTDRWYGLSASSELVDDYRSIDYGTPKFYTFELDGCSQRVHHTRVLRYTNRKEPRLLEMRLNGWGVSELEHIYQDLKSHENTKSSIASLLSKALLEIVKVKGMRSIMSGLAAGSTNSQAQLAAQLTALTNYRTSNNMMMMDADDGYENVEYSFSGLSDILEIQKDLIAGAAEMPKVLLYGDTKGGLSSDSPAEMEFYASTILGKQEAECRPVLDKLIPILFKTEGIDIPADLDYDFESIAGITQEKQQSLLSSTLSTVTSMKDAGLLTAETALEEIVQISKQTGFGSNITDRDKELVKKMDEAEEQMPEDQAEEMSGPTEEENKVDNITETYADVKPEILTTNKKFFDKMRKSK